MTCIVCWAGELNRRSSSQHNNRIFCLCLNVPLALCSTSCILSSSGELRTVFCFSCQTLSSSFPAEGEKCVKAWRLSQPPPGPPRGRSPGAGWRGLTAITASVGVRVLTLHISHVGFFLFVSLLNGVALSLACQQKGWVNNRLQERFIMDQLSKRGN